MSLIDIFTKHIYDLYGVTENQARFLYERWNVSSKYNEQNIKSFIESDVVKSVFFITPELNISKKYTKQELSTLGIALTEIDPSEHIYKDTKYNFTWKEVYHGFSDTWTGYYKIKDPSPKDEHLI